MRINEIKLLLDDIEELRHLAVRLLHAPNYREYLSQLNTLRARSYPLNIQILQLKTQLPPPDQLRQIMRYGQKEEERKALQAAENSILNDSPTFTTEFPATQEQISFMENIFNSRSLLSPLYQIYTPRDGNIWIAEQAPEIDESGKVRFRRSTFDPYHQLGESRNIILPHDKGMIVNRLDARALIDMGQLERDKFYNHAHLAQLLTDIVQYNNPSYPILAQAFIFDQVLHTLERHPSGYISGLALSPALQGDIQSFHKLVATCGIKLDGQSYLSLSPQHERAAEQFRQWFHAHRGQNYINDMRRNLRQILLVPANYVGFVNGAHKAVLKQELPENQQVWYFHQKEAKLKLGTLEKLEEAAPFSPILRSVEQSLP